MVDLDKDRGAQLNRFFGVVVSIDGGRTATDIRVPFIDTDVKR
jgi:hypothetical protein